MSVLVSRGGHLGTETNLTGNGVYRARGPCQWWNVSSRHSSSPSQVRNRENRSVIVRRRQLTAQTIELRWPRPSERRRLYASWLPSKKPPPVVFVFISFTLRAPPSSPTVFFFSFS